MDIYVWKKHIRSKQTNNKSHLNCTAVGSSLCKSMQEDRRSTLLSYTLLESKPRLLPCAWANESGLRALYANCNINCVATFPSTKISSTLEYSSDGVLCLEKWLVLLRAHTVQFSFSQCTAHAVLSGYSCSLDSRLTHFFRICHKYLHKNLLYPGIYVCCPYFIAPT